MRFRVEYQHRIHMEYTQNSYTFHTDYKNNNKRDKKQFNIYKGI